MALKKISEFNAFNTIANVSLAGIETSNGNVIIPIASLVNYIAESIGGVGGEAPPAAPIEFSKSETHLLWRLSGNSSWTELIAIDDIKGEAASALELRKSETHIQWRVSGSSDWIDLFPISELISDPISDFYNLSSATGESYILSNAIQGIPEKLKKLGLVVTFIDTISGRWVSHQYIGNDLSYWTNENYWINVISSYPIDYINIEYKPIELNSETLTYTIDYNLVQNGVIDLQGSVPNVTHLQIINVPVNKSGKILIKQSGGKVLIPSPSLIQQIELPVQTNRKTIIKFENISNFIYLSQDVVIGDVAYDGPEIIDDFVIDFFDGINLRLKWTEPNALAPNDVSISGYDIRYSHAPITTEVQWLNAVKLKTLPPLVGANIENSFNIKLKYGKDYFIYVRTFKNYRGSYHVSPISNAVNVTTKTQSDIYQGLPEAIPVSGVSAYPKLNKYEVVGGSVAHVSNLFDKNYENISLEDVRPNESVKILGESSWVPQKFWEDSLPYYVVFDLNGLATIDSVYLFTKERINVKVYATKSSLDPWVPVGDLYVSYNGWGKTLFTELSDKQFRYIKLSWEGYHYALNSPLPIGTPIWSTSKEFEGELKSYQYFGVFGYPVGAKPLDIRTPLRDGSQKYTIGEALNTNGHFYQAGRIHSLVGGATPRLFGNYNNFDVQTNFSEPNKYGTVRDFKFLTEQLSWVSGHCPSPVWTLRDLLELTYRPYALKPILTSSAPLRSILRKVQNVSETGEVTYNVVGDSKHIDQNYFSKDNPPSPTKGPDGINAILNITEDPLNYKINSKLCTLLAAKYGRAKLSIAEESDLPIETEGFNRESKISGLDLIGGIEPGNEMNKTWKGWEGYQQPSEAAAWLSSLYDGHLNILEDELGNKILGIKNIDPNLKVLNPGLTSADRGYLFHQDFKAKQLRGDASIPLDVYSVHVYSSDLGTEQAVSGIGRGLPYDMSAEVQRYLRELVRYRNTFAVNKEIWITEFGFGESGGYDTNSKLAAYSFPGYLKDGLLVPDVHRSEIKFAWTIRSILTALNIGVNMLHYYSTECENNWFDISQWGQGAGYEMFEWDKISDNSPGARFNAMSSHMVPYARTGFASMGLFGQLLANGAYPIARGTWRYMTFRNRLKDYYFLGFKKVDDKDDLNIACFSHKSENKSAFVIYRVGNTNSAYTNVRVEIPNDVVKVEHVKSYIPKLPDPRSVPFDYGYGIDYNRTSLPTSTRTLDDNGKVISATFPTAEENPFFPIVGPVGSKGVFSQHPSQTELSFNYIQANQYVNENKSVNTDNTLAWRQVDAICDYIEFHPEGIKGSWGELIETPIIQKGVIINVVTEIPEIYLVDGGIIKPSFSSKIEDLSARALGANSIKLYWNNANPKDEYYDIYRSQYPDGGYELIDTVSANSGNEYMSTGLNSNTTYYYRIQPKYDNQSGEISDYATDKTFSFIESPTDLVASGSSLSSVRLAFNSVYKNANNSSFLFYQIERRNAEGTVETFKITNPDITEFIDNSVLINVAYQYRVKVVTYIGDSVYTEYSEGSGLALEQASPSVIKAQTDKVVNIIRLLFDIDLDGSNIDESLVSCFLLTENGNDRVLTNVAIDTEDSKVLVLTYYSESISLFTENLPLLISYNKPLDSQEQIKSIYGCSVNSFSDLVVFNVYGNVANLLNTYQVNLSTTSTEISGWSTMMPDYTKTTDIQLRNKFNTLSEIRLYSMVGAAVINNITYRWSNGSNTHASIVYNSPRFSVPPEVYKTYSTPPFQSKNDRLYYGYYKLTNLDKEKYNFHFFCSRVVAIPVYMAIVVNGVEVGNINVQGNQNNIVSFTDIVPENGEIHIYYYAEATTTGTYPCINFFVIEEFGSLDLINENLTMIQNVEVE